MKKILIPTLLVTAITPTIILVGCGDNEDPKPTPEDIKVTDITVTLDRDIILWNESIKATFTVSPSDATDKTITWSSSNKGVATIDENGNITVVSPGTTEIIATANDGSGVVDSQLLTILSIEDVFELQLSDTQDSYTITDFFLKGMPGHLTIPYQYNNLPVTSIGMGAFSSCQSLSSITVPEVITYIDRSAFSGCESLQSINIPENITSISPFTFNGCFSLESIQLPQNLISIGEAGFGTCSELTSITIPNTTTTIGVNAFIGCWNLKSINIPGTVTTLGVGAFNSCYELNNIDVSQCTFTSIPEGWSIVGPFAYISDTGTIAINNQSQTQMWKEYFTIASNGGIIFDDQHWKIVY